MWIGIAVLYLIATADIVTSMLTRTAKVLWVLTLFFLPVVGLAAWLLTRGSAHLLLDDSESAAE